MISRRTFLSLVPLCSETALNVLGARLRQGSVVLRESDLNRIRSALLVRVNTERATADQSTLEADELATKVAQQHAVDMVTGKFFSHWGRDGRKPYQRYSLAGGIHATAENVSAVDNYLAGNSRELGDEVLYQHSLMHAETPPNDGHRKTILAPQYTHAGFGIATAERDLRLVEVYVAKYIEAAPVPRLVKLKDKLTVSGRLLDQTHKLHYVDVHYEPLPSPPDLAWLRVGRAYALPDTFKTLRPKLHRISVSAGTSDIYVGGDEGIIETDQT